MKILLHICCAPCAVYPLRRLLDEGHDVTGLFFNPNIHPYQEFRKRLETVEVFAKTHNFKLIAIAEYGLEKFLRSVVFREKNRCIQCYCQRFEKTAGIAKRGKYDAYTSTLLYSKYQKHDLIAEIGAVTGKAAGIAFRYEDYRLGWREGIKQSRELGLYRQNYCGCIFSERERFEGVRAAERTD
ncbi:MAG: epoxyqueuosine reductase QueH [Deltaproteobacteria bacterium]|nr:epoxyqueuosine reductase QueH [Deltaproteobacteria bacterium]